MLCTLAQASAAKNESNEIKIPRRAGPPFWFDTINEPIPIERHHSDSNLFIRDASKPVHCDDDGDQIPIGDWPLRCVCAGLDVLAWMNELPFEKVRRFAWVAKRLSKAGSYLQAQLPFTSQLPRTECAQLYTSFHLMSYFHWTRENVFTRGGVRGGWSEWTNSFAGDYSRRSEFSSWAGGRCS